MRKQLITAWFVSIMVAAASAQVAESFGTDTNVLVANPVPAREAAPSGGFAYPAMAGTGIDESSSFGLGGMIGEPLDSAMKLWALDVMANDAGGGRASVDPEGSRIHADALFPKFDVFRAGTNNLPVYIGVGRPVNFVEYGDTRTGVRTPVGVAFPLPGHRWECFAEVAPILDVMPTTDWGWSGAVGIRFSFRR